ncbi:PREDICTED: receptor kinase-like protein Xa21 [Ipomoea nil]|uniref:receptor kinase-like protein Xa21 n=1 Tax=Ipomoea nil TaxID=35883 RepID=UPI000900D3CC|nr:PREDICTED: receptor kinase-like protein Xa21 [Ipomoea nil]
MAIILEFIPNGSLDKWLYSDRQHLSLVQRIDIVTDIAMALEYLHHDYTVPIVHCDLKPSNVLLDEDLVAHVADFGISKVFTQDETLVQTKTLGTIGYLAPEYGQDGHVSTSSDVYSFGILLLETFTRKKPTDDMFSGDLTLQKWVSCSLPDALMEVLDADLFVDELGWTRDCSSSSSSGSIQIRIEQLLASIIHVALLCLKESPEDRINTRNVVIQLKKIKAEFSKLSYKSKKLG